MPARFKLVDGVRIYPSGREVCVTRAAWNRRREERFGAANGRCECREKCASHSFRGRCSRPLALSGREAKELGIWLADAHHVDGRGIGGGKRDDRLSEIRIYCRPCHLAEEERRRFRGRK